MLRDLYGDLQSGAWSSLGEDVHRKAATLRDTFALALISASLSALLACPIKGHAEEKALGAYRGAKTTHYPDWFKDSFLEFADDITEAAESGRRVMIIFHQDNCPYCNALVERNLSQKQIEKKVRDNFDVIAVNMWGDRDVVTVEGESFSEKEFAQALKVQFTPTILIFDEHGQVALRLNGYLPPEKFEAAIDYAAGRMESRMSYNQYLSETTVSAPSGQMMMEDFCTAPPADLSAADQAERPTAVFFEQKHCPNCDVLHHKVLSDPPTRAIAKKFRCVQLDMWSGDEVTTPGGEVTGYASPRSSSGNAAFRLTRPSSPNPEQGCPSTASSAIRRESNVPTNTRCRHGV